MDDDGRYPIAIGHLRKATQIPSMHLVGQIAAAPPPPCALLGPSTYSPPSQPWSPSSISLHGVSWIIYIKKVGTCTGPQLAFISNINIYCIVKVVWAIIVIDVTPLRDQRHLVCRSSRGQIILIYNNPGKTMNR